MTYDIKFSHFMAALDVGGGEMDRESEGENGGRGSGQEDENG